MALLSKILRTQCDTRPDMLKYSGGEEKKSNRMIPFGQDYYLSYDNNGKDRLHALAGEDEERRQGAGLADSRAPRRLLEQNVEWLLDSENALLDRIE